MCGISGIIKSHGNVTPSDLERAASVMHHRGPDAESYWISEDEKIGFGHVRLSIVDPDPRSTQPFSIEDGDYVMVFNGEIYNYRKLRKMLEETYGIKFTTLSDTEVLLHMYKHFGKKCLEYIEGMFVFVIYDKKEGHTFVARDFAGQKPLVYIEHGTGFYFASEIPGLFALCPDFEKVIDPEAIKLYMIGNFFHLPHHISFFQGVKKLQNAGYLIIKNGKILEKGRYAKLTPSAIQEPKDEVQFLDTILDEMRPSDVGFASFLSGGIDSSYICSVLKSHETTPTEAYTLKISENDRDYTRSKHVAEKLDLHHHTIELSDFDSLQSVDQTVKNLGEPYFHITSVYADKILQEAKKDHKVFFTGAGGDECYYGYDNILFILMEYYFRLERYIPNSIKHLLDKCTAQKYTPIIFSNRKTFKHNYYTANYGKISSFFSDSTPPTRLIKNITDDTSEFIHSDDYRDTSYMYGLFLENLHSLTIQGDVIGMKNSIEIRSLFLEKRVIERAYGISFWKKVSLLRLREGKEILRKGLIKIFGRDFVYAQKIGFGVHYDFRKVFEEQYGKIIQEKIEKLSKRGIFEKGEILSLRENFKKNFQAIMKLYTIEICLELYID